MFLCLGNQAVVLLSAKVYWSLLSRRPSSCQGNCKHFNWRQSLLCKYFVIMLDLLYISFFINDSFQSAWFKSATPHVFNSCRALDSLNMGGVISPCTTSKETATNWPWRATHDWLNGSKCDPNFSMSLCLFKEFCSQYLSQSSKHCGVCERITLIFRTREPDSAGKPGRESALASGFQSSACCM